MSDERHQNEERAAGEHDEYKPPEITVLATVEEVTLGTLEINADMGPNGSL